MLVTLQSFKAACAALMHATVAGLNGGPACTVVVVVAVPETTVVDVVVPWMVVLGFSVVDVLVGRAVEDVELVVVVVGGSVDDVLDEVEDVVLVVLDVVEVELVVVDDVEVEVVVGIGSGRLSQLVMHEPRAARHSAIGFAGGHPKLLVQCAKAPRVACRQVLSPRHRGPAVLQAILHDAPQVMPLAMEGSSQTAYWLMHAAAQRLPFGGAKQFAKAE